jgi:ribosomal protein S14
MARGSNRQGRRDSLGGLTQAAYARKRGVSREAIRKAIEAGRIPTLKSGRIDPKKADAALLHNTDPSRSARAGVHLRRRPGKRGPVPALPGALPKFAESRARREHYLAELAQLEFEERLLQRLPADGVRQGAFNAGRRVRDQLLAVPDRVAKAVVGMTDQAGIRGIIHGELRRVCDELGAPMPEEPTAPPADSSPPAAAEPTP